MTLDDCYEAKIKFWTQNWKRTSTYQHTCLKVTGNPIQKKKSYNVVDKLHGGPKFYLFCSRHPLRILYPRKHWDFKYWTQLLRRLDFEARITKALKTKLNLKQSRCPIPTMKKSMGQLWSSAVDQLYSEVRSQTFITPASSENWRINEI